MTHRGVCPHALSPFPANVVGLIGVCVSQVFSVMGYSIDTRLTWEDQEITDDGTASLDGKLCVTTMVTTAADGYLLSGWTKTTRITHALNERGDMVVTVIDPAGQYLQWLTREPSDRSA
jgi:hypothetical protein